MKDGGDAELNRHDESLSPAQMYARALDLDEVWPDPAQQQVIELLQARYVQLMQTPLKDKLFAACWHGSIWEVRRRAQPLKDSICGAE